MANWTHNNFERTTIQREFFSGDNFAEKYVKDFTVVVSEPRSAKNWATNVEAGTAPDRLQLERLAPLLTRIADGTEPELAQGDSAAAAAGLKEMSMGFGGPDSGKMLSTLGAP